MKYILKYLVLEKIQWAQNKVYILNNRYLLFYDNLKLLPDLLSKYLTFSNEIYKEILSFRKKNNGGHK